MEFRLNKVTYGDEEVNEVLDSLRSGNVTMGSKCKAFETAFATYQNSRHAVFVNSGSSANLLTWFALTGNSPTSSWRSFESQFEVIVPAVSWSTTIWPIVQSGGIPVLVDCDPDSLAIRPDAIESAITESTSAVCVVHPLGNMCDMERIGNICQSNDLILLEDSCETLGSTYRGNMSGTFGLASTFSFYFSHHMTTIEGGMIVTSNDEMASRLLVMRSHGWSRGTRDATETPFDERYLFVSTGFNLRPTEINGAFGLHQLKKLTSFNDARKHLAEQLTLEISDIIAAGHLRPMRPTKDVDAVLFGFSVLCSNTDVRDAFAMYLESRGVEVRPIICGNMARQPAMANVTHRIGGSLSGADEIMACGLYWGLHPGSTDEEIEQLGAIIREFDWW